VARFEWDEAKSRSNRLKHGIRFKLAVEVFDDPRAKSIQDREVREEERWQTIGIVRGIHLLLAAHTFRDDDGEEVIRIISARKATRSEQRIYEESD
jgi:hypothetical protein